MPSKMDKEQAEAAVQRTGNAAIGLPPLVFTIYVKQGTGPLSTILADCAGCGAAGAGINCDHICYVAECDAEEIAEHLGRLYDAPVLRIPNFVNPWGVMEIAMHISFGERALVQMSNGDLACAHVDDPAYAGQHIRTGKEARAMLAKYQLQYDGAVKAWRKAYIEQVQ